MKLSCHTMVVNDYPKRGEHILYHTRTQAMIKIDQDLKDVLDHLDPRGDTFSPLHVDHLKKLHQMDFIVKEEEEDFEKMQKHFQQLKYGYNKLSFAATILTTYGCNLGCTYCFQENTRSMSKMSRDTQEHTLRWIKERVKRLGYQRVYLNYYGGEPLLNPDAINYISFEMKEWCGVNGLQFAFGIQTNGYLLTPQKVDKFKELGLSGVRISLDGVKEDHDQNRPLRGGGGSFDRIMQNIMDCIGKIEISISMSYVDNDMKPIEKLLDYLDELQILHKLGGEFVFSPIIPSVGPKGKPEAIRGSACMCNSEDQALADAATKLEVLMKRKGLPSKSGMSTSICPLVRENSSVTIDQEGLLYRCNPLLGHPEFSVGDVFHDAFNEAHTEFRDLDVWKQCPVDCTYMPMCSGGCRLMSFVGGNKNFKVASCKKPYLDEMAPKFIKRDYDRMLGQKQKQEQSMSEKDLMV